MKLVLLGGIGPWQIAVIALAILLLFGGRKIPELMRGLGRGMKEFKNAKNDTSKESEENQDK